MNTPHQERSEIYYSQDVQMQLTDHAEILWVQNNILLQMNKLGLWQVANYIKAKNDKAMGGEGLVHTVTFDN